MRRLLVIVAVLGVATVSCTTGGSGGGGGGGHALPTPPVLEGWTKIGRAWSPGPGAATSVLASPNARFVVYQTDDTFPGDVDPYPNQQNLYELDRTSGINHMISPWLASGIDVRDDGAVLVSYRDSAVAPLHPGVYTVDTGLVALTPPMDITGCSLSFEPAGSGFELRCDGTDDRALGLYRFDVGDAAATPVVTVANLPSDRRSFASVSPNHRYVEYTDWTHYWVYDEQSATTLPYSFGVAEISILQPIFATMQYRSSNPVADDGRLAIERAVFDTELDQYREMWFDPHDGSKVVWAGFPMMAARKFFPGTNLFSYDDYTAEIGHNYLLERREPLITPILSDLTSPSTRWQLPFDTRSLVDVAPNGDIIMTSPATTNPGDTNPGTDIFVRTGPLA